MAPICRAGFNRPMPCLQEVMASGGLKPALQTASFQSQSLFPLILTEARDRAITPTPSLGYTPPLYAMPWLALT